MKHGFERHAAALPVLAAAIALMGCATATQEAVAATAQAEPQPSSPEIADDSPAPPAMFLTAAPEAESEPPVEEVANWSTCEDDETSIFQADSVDDEFGYGIEVCIGSEANDAGEKLVTVIWSGEGGNLRTSCFASECDGVIEYNRYTRPRFTELTLKWKTENASHRIVESFNAEGPEAGPESSANYHYLSTEMVEREMSETDETIAMRSEPLSLMAIESHLGS